MSEQLIKTISKYTNLIVTTAIISLVLTLVNYSGTGFPIIPWLRAWLIAFLLLSVLLTFLPQLIGKIVAKIFSK